jgi:putative ABC transport system permease protein
MHALVALIIAGFLWISRKYLITGTQFRKALNDLLERPGRAVLVVVALMIGLWGVGTIMVSTSILRNDLSENFLQTRPLHAILTSKNFDRLDLAKLRALPEVESAEFRDLLLERIEVYPNEWISLWLFGIEDFRHFNLAQFQYQSGDSIPRPGSMLIERDCLSISDLKAGMIANVQAGRRRLQVPISGVCFDPAQAPATQDHMVYGYVDKGTWGQITGEPVNQRLIVRVKNPRTTEDVQAAVNRIVAYLRSADITLTTLNIPELNEHPHQWQLNTILYLIGTLGFLAFVMGAVLVSQLMAAIMSQQIRQIGMLKAIGASKWQVLRIYNIMVVLLGVVAGAVAIPLAVSSGFAFARFVATKINFEILTSQLPTHVYLALVAASLLLPIAFSLPALLRGVRIPVREALGDYGIKQNGGGKKTAKASSHHLPSTLIMAVRNVGRRRRRLAVTVVTIALGVAMFASGFNVRQSLANLLSDMKNGMKYDAQVVFKEQIPRGEAVARFQSLDNVSRIETWNGGRGGLQTMIVATDDGVGIVALPYNTDLFQVPLADGRWLQNSDETEVVMNRKATEIYKHLAVGSYQTLQLKGKEMRVKLVGVVDELEKAKIYMDIDKYDAFANPEHLVNSLMFVATDKSYDKVKDLMRNIEKVISASDLDVLYAMVPAERVKIIYDHLNIILTIIVFLAFLVLLVAALGMASATGINIMERTREIGVLRAIGATPRQVYTLFVTEGMIISGAGIALGLLLAWPLSSLAAPFFGSLMLGDGGALRFAWSGSGAVITLAATVIFGWLASRIPAGNAVKISTREALAYE